MSETECRRKAVLQEEKRRRQGPLFRSARREGEGEVGGRKGGGGCPLYIPIALRLSACTVNCCVIVTRLSGFLLCVAGCSQQRFSVSQGRICSDSFTCCHTEIGAANKTFYLTQSQYTDSGPTIPSADPITPAAWQGSHGSANFSVTSVTPPRKRSAAQAGIEPRSVAFSADAFTTRPTRRCLSGTGLSLPPPRLPLCAERCVHPH